MKRKAKIKSALNVTQDAFDSRPMDISWALKELTSFVDSKSNIRSCETEVLKSA
jgi:hypothetical protein